MMERKHVLLPGAQSCSRQLAGVNRETYVLELLFTGRCSGNETVCGACPILSRNARTMKLQVAENAVREAVAEIEKAAQKIGEEAKGRGFNALHIQLIGGDPLCVFEPLDAMVKELDNWRQSFAQSFTVTLGLTTCGDITELAIRAWLQQQAEAGLRCSFRWNGPEGARRWQKEQTLWEQVVDTVLWSVRPDTLPTMLSDIRGLLEKDIRVCLEYPNLESWTLGDLEDYVRILNQMTAAEASVLWESHWDMVPCGNPSAHGDLSACGDTFARGDPSACGGMSGSGDASACGGTSVCGAAIPCVSTVDIGGKGFPCRFLSPERMRYSQLQNRQPGTGRAKTQRDSQYSIPEAYCPAELELSQNRLCMLLNKLHLRKLDRG